MTAKTMNKKKWEIHEYWMAAENAIAIRDSKWGKGYCHFDLDLSGLDPSPDWDTDGHWTKFCSAVTESQKNEIEQRKEAWKRPLPNFHHSAFNEDGKIICGNRFERRYACFGSHAAISANKLADFAAAAAKKAYDDLGPFLPVPE